MTQFRCKFDLRISVRLAIAVVALSLIASPTATRAQEGDSSPEFQGDGREVYDNGGIYEGEFKDGKQHGRGTFRLPDGYEYTGEWFEGADHRQRHRQVRQRRRL